MTNQTATQTTAQTDALAIYYTDEICVQDKDVKASELLVKLYKSGFAMQVQQNGDFTATKQHEGSALRVEVALDTNGLNFW